MTTTDTATTVTRTAVPPRTTDTGRPQPPAEEDRWAGMDMTPPDERQYTGGGRSSGGGRGGRGRAAMPELPPVRTLAERRRRPAGTASHPILLVSGGNHSGKSYEAALLTGDERIGPAYWLEIGRETTAHWYGQVPGADYEIIEHDGSWRDIMASLEQSHDEAHQLVAAPGYDGRPPLLVIDSMTGEWELLSAWAENRAVSSRSGIETLLDDPHADVEIGALLWNSARRRHRAFMRFVTGWPGPVVLTARGKMALAIKEGTNKLDYNGPKQYSVECQRDLPFEVTMHVRLDVKAHPEVLGYRHPRHGIGGRYGGKSVVINPENPRFREVTFSLAYLIFQVMGYDPATAVTRPLVDADPVADTDDRPMPVPRRLTPDQVAQLAAHDAGETPGGAIPAETTPQQTR